MASQLYKKERNRMGSQAIYAQKHDLSTGWRINFIFMFIPFIHHTHAAKLKRIF